MTTNVLVTGGRSPVALHLARMLHRHGLTVYMAESEPYHLSKKSKAIARNLVVPKPNDDYEAFIQALVQYCLAYEIHLLIPTCEEIFHIAKGKALFERHGITVFCEEMELLRMLHNKYTFNRYLQAQGFNYPDTHQFTSLYDLQHFLKDTSIKYVLKASYSRFASHVYFVTGADELPRIAISPDNPWVLQRYIAGSQFCTYSVAKKGNVTAHTCYPTIYTAGLGANVFFKHTEEPELEQFVQRFVKELNFTGQIAFDFIKAADGAFYPLECNPRATSGLHLFEEVANFAQLFVGASSGVLYPSATATYKLGLPMLLCGVTEGDLLKRPRAFLRDFQAARDVIYAGDDRAPYFYQAVYLLAMLCRKLQTGKSLTELTTTDIEWGGK